MRNTVKNNRKSDSSGANANEYIYWGLKQMFGRNLLMDDCIMGNIFPTE